MSFPPYAEYKDSGVAWLGAVPGHWAVERITNLYREVTEAGNDDLPILSVSIHSGVSDDEAAPEDLDRKVSRSDDRSKYKQVQPNDLVYNMMRAWQGGFGAVQVYGMVSPAYVVARPRSNAPSKYVELLLRTSGAVEEMRRRSRGVTDFRLRLYWDEFKDMRIALPPVSEQEAIMRFLDREVGKIDGLVAEQERLIALLKEKRQAVISHAVTKGLNPSVPLKNSGIEWLGQIPEHWEVKRLRHIATLNPSKSEAAEFDSDTEVSFLPMEAIGEDGSLALERTRAIAEVSTGYTYFREGDVTIAKITPCFENGKGAVMRGLVQGVGFGTTELIVVRPQENVTTSAYLDWVFRTRPFRALGEGAMYGAGGQKRVPDDFVRDFAIGIPPMGEQAQIIAYLDQISASFDALSSEAQSAITLLAERRAALISAAVTGKIDVRGAVAQPAITTSPQPSLQAVVGSYAILRFGKLGRMVVMKLGYLAEAHAGLSLGGHYTRYAAGPYDRNLCNAMERGAATACGIVIGEPQFEGGAVKYTIPSHCRTPSDELKALVGTDHAAAFEAMLTSLKDLNRDDIEAIATLYAVWNDLLAAGKQADDDSICSGVLNDWHPEKPLKFSRDQLVTWLEWMRRNGFVPDGTAPRTDHQGSLFG